MAPISVEPMIDSQYLTWPFRLWILALALAAGLAGTLAILFGGLPGTDASTSTIVGQDEPIAVTIPPAVIGLRGWSPLKLRRSIRATEGGDADADAEQAEKNPDHTHRGTSERGKRNVPLSRERATPVPDETTPKPVVGAAAAQRAPEPTGGDKAPEELEEPAGGAPGNPGKPGPGPASGPSQKTPAVDPDAQPRQQQEEPKEPPAQGSGGAEAPEDIADPYTR